MSFRITGLDAVQFSHLFGLSDAELEAHGARRYHVDACPGFPDRVEMRDMRLGETAILLHHTYQPAATPYRASHAIYVREGGGVTYDAVNEIPDVLSRRLLSLRAFDAEHMMIDADIVEGSELHIIIERMLEQAMVTYIQVHYAKRGCYAGRVERV